MNRPTLIGWEGAIRKIIKAMTKDMVLTTEKPRAVRVEMPGWRLTIYQDGEIRWTEERLAKTIQEIREMPEKAASECREHAELQMGAGI